MAKEINNEEKVPAKEAPKKVFNVAVLSDRLMLLSDSLVLEVTVGGKSNKVGGKVEIGVSFGDVNEKRVSKKLKNMKKSDKEIEAELSLQRLGLVAMYKEEILDKAKDLGLGKGELDSIEAELKADDLLFLLN